MGIGHARPHLGFAAQQIIKLPSVKILGHNRTTDDLSAQLIAARDDVDVQSFNFFSWNVGCRISKYF